MLFCGPQRKEWMMLAIFRQLPRQRAALTLLLSACALLCGPAYCVEHGLTQEQLERLLKVVDQRGSRTTIPPAVASVLQLQASQHTPDIKEVAYLDEQGGRHGFAPLKDGSGFFMFSSGASSGQIVYWVDPDLRLVRAARSLMKNGPLLALPDAEARRELDDEFRQWSKLLSPNGPVVRPKPGPAPDPSKPDQSKPDQSKPDQSKPGQGKP
jgi:hypothetical protein